MPLEKRLWEKRILTIDMTPALADASISTLDSSNPVTVTAQDGGADITVSNIKFENNKVAFLASGGEDGKGYTVRVRVNTSGSPGQRLETVVLLLVRG